MSDITRMAGSPVRDLPTINAFDFPVYEVITPHTKKSFLMRSMTVAQESVLKESAVSTSKALSIINQTIFECAENKEAPYDTLAGFEKNLTMGDRKALLAGLFIATYGEEQDFVFTCPSCGKEIKVRANVPLNIEYSMYDGEDSFIDKRVEVELPVSKWRAVLKAPTLADEKAFSMTRNISREVMSKMEDYQVVEKLIVPAQAELDPSDPSPKKKKKNLDMIFTNIIDIYTKFNSLPARDRKALFKAWTEVFGGPRININIPAPCANCGNESSFPVEPIEELFRQLS